MHNVAINIRSGFYDNNKHYPQVFLDKHLYKLLHSYYHIKNHINNLRKKFELMIIQDIISIYDLDLENINS